MWCKVWAGEDLVVVKGGSEIKWFFWELQIFDGCGVPICQFEMLK